jgi:hypothetical protein
MPWGLSFGLLVAIVLFPILIIPARHKNSQSFPQAVPGSRLPSTSPFSGTCTAGGAIPRTLRKTRGLPPHVPVDKILYKLVKTININMQVKSI